MALGLSGDLFHLHDRFGNHRCQFQMKRYRDNERKIGEKVTRATSVHRLHPARPLH